LKQLLILAAASLVLALPASSSAATTTVKIVPGTPAAFQPASVSVSAGDTVQWTNTTNVDRQVVGDGGAFVSPILKPNQSYSFTFKAADTYTYHDALHPAVKGSVAVKGPPPNVRLDVDTAVVRYGQSTTIHGSTTGGNPGDSVTITAQPLNGSSQAVGTATTDSNGDFTYTVKPTILTTYTATWKGTSSQSLAIQVRPRVTLAHLTAKRLYVKVRASVPHAGSYVFIQRRTGAAWRTVLHLRLGPNSGRYFTAPHIRGNRWYRAYLTLGQAGEGYIDSTSNSVRVHYR
jgi:plastocyanin